MDDVWLCWSSGKDSAWALRELRRDSMVLDEVFARLTGAEPKR